MNERKAAVSAPILDDGRNAVKINAAKQIRVTVRIPENITEIVRQQKINRIYDILNPESSK